MVHSGQPALGAKQVTVLETQGTKTCPAAREQVQED